MPSTSDNDQSAKSALTKLRAEIRQCEEFLALCDRIKHLEQLDDSSALRAAKERLERQRTESLFQFQQLQEIVRRDEGLLSANASSAGSMGMESLRDQIKSCRIRGSTLRLSAEEATKQIEVIELQVEENTHLLQELYTKLEQHMQQGFHPNTVVENLEKLRELRNDLAAQVKENFPLKASEQKNPEPSEKRAPPNAVPVEEDKFFAYLAEDLAMAKKNITILSPGIGIDRARLILPILAKLVTQGCHVTIWTRPPDEHDEPMKQEAMHMIRESHRLSITIMQKSGLQENVAIIDDRLGWEGQIGILGPSPRGKTMRRIAGSSSERELRHFLNDS
jgi:hypothetical protein